MRFALVLPATAEIPPGIPEDGVTVVRYTDAASCVAALAGAGGTAVVLVSDALPEGSGPAVATAVRAAGRPAVEVRSAPWDGVSPSPVSAACRGVISGFGAGGVGAALRVLRRDYP